MNSVLQSNTIWVDRDGAETCAASSHQDCKYSGGVRIAGLGALWQAVMLGFAGLDLRGDTLGIDPKLPPQWRSGTTGFARA